jgi:hypothetical protein
MIPPEHHQASCPSRTAIRRGFQRPLQRKANRSKRGCRRRSTTSRSLPARAPHRASVPDNVATSTDKLKTPFSFAFLPGGEIHGKRWHPAHPRRGWHALPAHCGRSHRARHRHLDVTLDPQFASNHRIFFTYSELVSQPVIEPYSNIAVACSPGRPCACRFARSLRCPRELCLRTRMAASGSGATAVCS